LLVFRQALLRAIHFGKEKSMSRKAFFAAFIIDEDTYTSAPGPADHHYVAGDLAQSSFGEQPGVSNIIVWSSAADLVADHRQRGPMTVGHLTGDQPASNPRFRHAPEACPSNHWNRGDDVCADCGADLGTANNDLLAPPPDATPSFRDQLVLTMRDALAFEYYEVRPCIERDRHVTSYRGEDEFSAELARSQEARRKFRAFWSLYGVDRNAVTAIGDFVSKDAAHEVMNAILAIPAAVRNALQDGRSAGCRDRSTVDQTTQSAADWLDDMINQSSNGQRI
jgi:hypothetical protein